MSYMIYGYGYDVPTEDALNINTREEADEIMWQRVNDWCDEHGIDPEDADFSKGDDYFRYGREEYGAGIFKLYEIPEFKNEVEELLWKAKFEMDKAFFASENYKFELCDCFTEDHAEEAKKYINRAMELMGGWKYKEVEA